MNLSLRALRYVVATAECGNVTEAARRLNVSQPSVSAAIAASEAEIGTHLFVRHHARGMTLTVAGQRYVNEARHLLAHARDFAQSAKALGESLRGEIALGCFLTLAPRFMPGLLAAFAQAQPGITVRLEEGDQQEIIEGVLNGRIELAVSYGYAVPEEVVGERLADLPPLLVVSADHRLAQRASVSLAEVADEPFLLYDLPHSRDYFFSLFTACGIEPRIAFRSRSYELIRGLVGQKRGYTIHNAAPRTTMAYDGSQVAVIPLTEALPPTRVMRLSLRRQALRPAVEVFASFLTQAFAEGGLFAPGSIAPAGIDPVQHRLA